MELGLTTQLVDDICTQGMLAIDGLFECYTLEEPYTDGSVGGAIPAGRFPVVAQASPHFLRVGQVDDWVAKYAAEMPHIIIPERTLIMLHWGDFVKDTHGCVLVGSNKGIDAISSSRGAFSRLYGKIYQPMIDGNCFLSVAR